MPLSYYSVLYPMATSPSPSHAKTITENNNNNVAIFDMESPPTSGTTFVQADPSNFRALVQKLTGVSRDSSSNHKLPVTYVTRESLGPQIPPFKLQDRRKSRKKLEINLQIVPAVEHPNSAPTNHITSSLPVQNRMFTSNGNDSRGEMGMTKTSAESTLDILVAQRMLISPRTAMSREKLEKRGIAEKGYYLHPTPPGCRGSDPPELLTLFPLHHTSST